MLGGGRYRRRQEEDTDLNMVPIMNLFLVLIPFLLMSASFFHIKAINTSIPVLAESQKESQKEKKVKLTVVVELQKDEVKLSALGSDVSQQELERWDSTIPMNTEQTYQLEAMADYLKDMKKVYPASDTLILIPAENVIYDTIIQTMDVARRFEDEPLFPNVVLSGSVG